MFENISSVELLLQHFSYSCTLCSFYMSGKNDGSVNQIRYFRCRPRHGIFVRHDKLIWDKKRKGSRKAAAMNRRSLNAQSVSPASKGGTSGKRK